jgi:GNAT superfamily N-acetyltransferase
MVSSLTYLCHPDDPLMETALAQFLAEVDSSLPEPLQSRSYFTSFEEVACRFLHGALIAYAETDSGALAGIAVVYADGSRYPRAYETYIGVHPAYRRLGVATRLSEMELELCQKAGASGIMTNCDPRNTAKISLNNHLGYVAVTDKKQIELFESANPKWRGKRFFIKDWA